MENEFLDYLTNFITTEKVTLIDKILSMRTKYITVVLEDIYQSQNASAVLRTADCFGIQDIHIVENRNRFLVNQNIAMGAARWLNINLYNSSPNNSIDAVRKLRNEGYRIVVTSPHLNDVDLPDFDITKGKFALVFGTELKGVSDEMKYEADEFLKIPMYGFTESLNISVSAAVVLNHLILKLHSSKLDWKLSDEEKSIIKLNWLRQSIKKVELIEKQYFEK